MLRLTVTVNFPQTEAGPGPNITATVDAVDAGQAMDMVKAKVLSWMEEQSKALRDGLPASVELPPVA